MNEVNRLFCPNCKKSVEAIITYSKGDEIYKCSICGEILNPDVTPPIKENNIISNNVKKKIVIIEDNKLHMEIIKKTLHNNFNVDILTFNSGYKFIGETIPYYLNKERYSLIIADIGLPQLNGVEISMVFREIERGFGIKNKSPILFFTAYKLSEKLKNYFKACSPSTYLPKGLVTTPEKFSSRLLKSINLLNTYSDKDIRL